MSIQNLIIYKFIPLYDILEELSLDLNFKISLIEDENSLNQETKNYNNYLVVSKNKYPNAKIFGITTGLPVMKINYELGYKPVTFSELTDDEAFWKGCSTCKNYDVLNRTKREMCLCTGMLYDPNKN